MKLKTVLLVAICALASGLTTEWTRAGVNARMLRQPDVSDTEITFVYAGDIWVVPKEGGVANRLSSPDGEEMLPRFSPDGSQIAFVANYDGNEDIYVLPRAGGTPRRLTYHPMEDRLLDWYPDGKGLLMASSRASGRQRFNQLYRVAAEGGLPERLPVPYGEFGAISPDEKLLAYTPRTRDFRTWKRYRGGMNPDIWLFNLETYASENITHDLADDSQPMWHGGTLYFLSDRGAEKRHNIWAYDTSRKSMHQVTQFRDFDIHFPAIGPKDIVFEAGGLLYLLDLSNEKYHQVAVQVVTDERTLKPRIEKVADLIMSAAISPTGKRAVIDARGDVFSLPAEHGVILNLTRDSGVAERDPVWSPDGKKIVYWSDRSGEYELTLRPADGTGEEEKLTSLGPGFRYTPFWSPDSKKVAFVDNAMKIQVFDLDSRQVTQIDQGLRMFQGALARFRVGWSPDSRWVAYQLDTPHQTHKICLYDLQNKEKHEVTSGYYDDTNPVFDPKGQYLFFLTNRTFDPEYSDFDNSWIYANATRIAAVPLTDEIASPLAPRNDVEGAEEKEKAEEGEKKDGNGKAEKSEAGGEPSEAVKSDGASQDESAKGDEKSAEKASEKSPKPVEVQLDGFERRLVLLPPKAGNYALLNATEGKVLYLRGPRTGADSDAKSELVFYDLKEREEKQIASNINSYDLSANGKKLLVRQERSLAIVDVAPKQELKKPLRTGELETLVDPRAEWRQIFNDAWRLERDFFYDPGMHGVDWPAMRAQYGKLIDDCVTRWDVNFVLGELVAELNSSHTYRGGGDTEHAPRLGVGLLGIDWALDQGAYRIQHIVRGAAWDTEVRSPLDEPDMDVKEGDYVLAVNGVPLDISRDPYASFQGLGEKDVLLTVNDRPSLEGAHQILVKTLSDETRLRHLEWIEQNRKRVDEASGGRVGYIYVRSTGIDGQTELARQFYAQFTKPGLIVDERFNSGGQIPDRFIELLDRKPLSFWAVRQGQDWQWPPVAHFGPKVMLINGWSGSGGDAFPYYFREAGLGPLIGSTTWGGLIGISGAPGLIDGGAVTVPTFRMYSKRGTWFDEGEGVKPDIEVVEDPTQMAKGTDPQLERAVQETLRLLDTNPPVEPKRPSYQNRSH